MPSRRARIWLIGSAGAALLIVGGILLALHLLLQPQRFTQLLQSAAQSAGLQLQLQRPASPELLPTPGVVLTGLRLSVPGHVTPMLSAARGKLVVPWRALLGGVPTITRLQLEAPQIDLGELDAYVASLPSGKAPWLPHIRAGVRIGDGSLISHGQPLLTAISIESGPLAPGQPFRLSIGARNAEAQPLQLLLQATPHSTPQQVTLQSLQLRGSLPGYGAFDLRGDAQWLGGSRVRMALSGSAGAPPYALDLAYQSAGTTPQLALRVRRSGQQLQARFDPGTLLAWWNGVLAQGNALPPLTAPPLAASASVASLQLGSVQISGLTLQVDANPAPPSSSTRPAASTRR